MITSVTSGVIIVANMLVPRIIVQEKKITDILRLIVHIMSVMMWDVKIEKKDTALIVANTNVLIYIVHPKNFQFMIIA